MNATNVDRVAAAQAAVEWANAHAPALVTQARKSLKEAELAAALKAPGTEAVLTESLYPGLTYAKTDK